MLKLRAKYNHPMDRTLTLQKLNGEIILRLDFYHNKMLSNYYSIGLKPCSKWSASAFAAKKICSVSNVLNFFTAVSYDIS